MNTCAFAYCRRLMIGVAAMALLLAIAGTAALALSGVYVPNEYIIHVNPGTSVATVQKFLGQIGASLIAPLPLADTYHIKMGQSPSYRATKSVLAKSLDYSKPVGWIIDRIQPNLVYKATAIPNDEFWDKQWDMLQINMPSAWNITKGSAAVKVAVLDSGVAQHPQLVARTMPGFDFVDNDNDPSDDIDGHGTHVSGTIAAQGNDGIGISGVCWNGVQIMPVRVLGDNGSGTTSWIIQGLDYATNNGADVVNMSLGVQYGYFDDAVQQALKRAAASNVILVAAAGNDGAGGVGIPAYYDECIAVGSTGPYEDIAPYSSYGPGNLVDIAAPGGDGTYGDNYYIWSTTVEWDANGQPIYGYAGTGWQGTSMACPHVAGAAALLISAGVSPTDVRNRLVSTARRPKTGVIDTVKYGAGILDVQAALAASSVRIVKPTKGGTVSADPDFKITLLGVDTTSIKVYVDYADSNDDGVPDSANETPVINSSNVNYYLNSNLSALEFKWGDPNLNVVQTGSLKSGAHKVYVSANAAVGGAQVSDWAGFNVTSKVLYKGIQMVSFPYAFADRMETTPMSLLPGVSFSLMDNPRATLIKWQAAPRSATDTTAIGYETYVPGRTFDRTWVNPTVLLGGVGLPLGGGFYSDLMTGQQEFAYPAGAGFWLVLPTDVVVNTAYDALETLPQFQGSKGYNIRLYKGWNMIGNPYAHDVPWRAALVTYRGQTKSLLEAESAGWVRSTLYGYGGAATGYVKVSDRESLQAYAGYWLFAQVGGISDTDSLYVNILP